MLHQRSAVLRRRCFLDESITDLAEFCPNLGVAFIENKIIFFDRIIAQIIQFFEFRMLRIADILPSLRPDRLCLRYLRMVPEMLCQDFLARVDSGSINNRLERSSLNFSRDW